MDDVLTLPSLAGLAAMVRARRRAEGLTQKSLADLAGVSHVTVVALERGGGNLRLENAWKILTVLGLAEEGEPAAY